MMVMQGATLRFATRAVGDDLSHPTSNVTCPVRCT